MFTPKTTPNLALAGVCLAGLWGVSGTSYGADPTLVQFDPSASGNFTVTGIAEFDWQSSGDLVIVDTLPQAATAGGVQYTTFADWADNAVVGDSVLLEAYTHARLNDMLDGGGGSILPNVISRDGGLTNKAGEDCASTTCVEVTVAANVLESAVLFAPGQLLFTTISGDYSFFLDATPDSNVGAGSGFNDGIAFLSGNLTGITGTFQRDSGGDNQTDSSVVSFDSDIISADPVDSKQLSDVSFDTLISTIGAFDASVGINGDIGLLPYTVQVRDLVYKADANSEFAAIEVEGLECRVTGGGVDENGNVVLGILANGEDGPNRYTFGGQAGASTAAQPQPFGEWTHHQQKGPAGSFVFHAGTASAPAFTEIDEVICSDDGFCDPARPADSKQIDFAGVGTFKNFKRNSAPDLAGAIVGETRHWFSVHIEDLGEPGNKFDDPSLEGTAACPATGNNDLFPRTPALPVIDDQLANCGCADFYRIRIYAPYDPTTEEPDKTNVIYEVQGYLDGGNLQIHPPVGG